MSSVFTLRNEEEEIKPKLVRRNEITDIILKINDIENIKTIEKINEVKS